MLPLQRVLLIVAIGVLTGCGPELTGPGDTTTESTVSSTTTTTSTPKPADTAVVPDLAGLSLGEARTVAGQAGLTITALPDGIREGTVFAQEPAAGAEVEIGNNVLLDLRPSTTCNPPDPLAPGEGRIVISVLFECGGGGGYPTAGIGVPRVILEPTSPVDRIEGTLRWMLSGPNTDEEAVGFHSAFDETTSDALDRVILHEGHLTVDFNDSILVNNMNTSTGMIFFRAELNRNVFQHAEVNTVEYRYNGSCGAWSALFESDGCRVTSRADWGEQLNEWSEQQA